MIQINSRHNFLERFLGAKPEEDISHARANEVNLWITLTTSICCVLEIVLYFVYNRKVSINKWKNIHYVCFYNSIIFRCTHGLPSLMGFNKRTRR